MATDIQTLKIGEGKPGPGRGVGSPNKSTRLLKDAILAAAALADAKIQERALRASNEPREAIEKKVAELKGSLEGYLCFLAIEEAPSFAALLGRVLPIQFKTSSLDKDDADKSARQMQQVGQALAFALRLGLPTVPPATPGDGAKVINGNASDVSHEARNTLDGGGKSP